MNRHGEYVPATPIPETVLVNVGDLMQRWTSDVLQSTVTKLHDKQQTLAHFATLLCSSKESITKALWFQKHRVLIPEAEVKRNEVRQSLAFFVHPDDNELIECIDGSHKYEPITALDYLNMRFAATY